MRLQPKKKGSKVKLPSPLNLRVFNLPSELSKKPCSFYWPQFFYVALLNCFILTDYY